MESIWTRSRGTPPARETLTREQIVKVAIETLDTEGLAGLSIRKLAAKLGSGATSLYWHVPTKDDLLDLAIDEIYAEVDVPGPELAGWRAGALLFGHSMRAVILRHPWLPEIVSTRPSIGPNAMSLASRGLVLFGAAGFTGPDLDNSMGVLMAYVFGSVGSEVAVHTVVRRAGRSIDEWAAEIFELGRTTSHDAPEMQESLRRRTGRDIRTMHNESFAFGLDTILDGLEARLNR